MTAAHTIKVVTIDDSPIIVNRVKEILAEIPAVEFVGNTHSFPSALELIKRALPDVVILDININSPDGKNGIDLLTSVRRIYPSITIIMLTNLANNRYRNLCLGGGANYFLDKSNDFDKIADILNHLREIKTDANNNKENHDGKR
jgi:DNA-binding NarL/FixJ family response regulator